MTEKRFTFVRDDNNKSIGILDNKYERKYLQWGQIARLLNGLNDENEQLKSDNNRLVNETAKIIGEHQRKVLNLIDRKIKDYNQQLDDEDIDDNLAYYMNVKGHIEAFKELKKELQE